MMIVATEGEITGFQAPLMVLSLEGTPQQLRCPIVVHADRHNTAVQEAGRHRPDGRKIIMFINDYDK